MAGRDHRGEDALDLAFATARKEPEERFVAGDPGLLGSERFEEGMTCEDRAQSARLVHRLLERKDADHQVEKASHFWNPSAVPSPNLRADVKENLPGIVAPPQGFRQPEIESRIVDQNDGVRLCFFDLVEHPVEFVSKVAVMLQDVPEPQDAGFRDPIVERFRGEGAHFRPSRTEKAQFRVEREQDCHHFGGAGVPAGLAGDEPQGGHGS